MTVDIMDNTALHGQDEKMRTLRFVRNGRCIKSILRRDRHTVVVACLPTSTMQAHRSTDLAWSQEQQIQVGKRKRQRLSRVGQQHTTAAALQKGQRTRYSAESHDDVSLFEESLGCPAMRICPRLVDPDGTDVPLFFCSFVLPGFTYMHLRWI